MKAVPDLVTGSSRVSSTANRDRANQARARKGGLYQGTKKCISVNRSELFAGLPSIISKEVIACGRPKDFVSGDVMYFAGDPIEQVLLLTDGRVKKSQPSECGREVTLRLTVPGELISDLALVPGGTHSSTAQALQDCKVLVWDSATFEAALDRFPDLRTNAHRILERRVAQLESRFFQLSTKTAPPRLAYGLVHLMDQLGRRVNSHIEIDVSQEILGQMTAMTPFQVCHLLNLWKGQGLVKLRKGVIEIHSVSRVRGLRKVR
jgi:CRP-like cAMP-binding protein